MIDEKWMIEGEMIGYGQEKGRKKKKMEENVQTRANRAPSPTSPPFNYTIFLTGPPFRAPSLSLGSKPCHLHAGPSHSPGERRTAAHGGPKGGGRGKNLSKLSLNCSPSTLNQNE